MDENDSIRRAYDDIAEVYADERSHDGRGMTILEEFLQPLPAEPRLLDAGCGQGAPVLPRLTREGTAVGLDFSRAQLELARENVAGASLCRGDLTALPFRDDAFDAVTAFHSLIHVPLEDHSTVLEEFARVLRPGGRALVSEGNDEWTGTNPDWLESGVEMRWHIAGAEATRSQLRDAGFTITAEWGVPDELAEDETRKPFFAAELEG